MPSRPQQFRASRDSNPQPGRRACSCHFGKQRENYMAKTNYQVTFNGKVVGICNSDSIYTHAVVVQDDADAFYHWAHNYVPNETDRKNFAYDSKRAVQIVEQYLAEWKYQKPDYVESRISEAKAKVEGGFETYAERLRQEKIQIYEDRLAKGGFLPYVAGWCGRPDLAQKASTKRDFVGPRYWGRTNFHRPHRDRTGQGEDVSEEEMIRRRLADLERMRRLP